MHLWLRQNVHISQSPIIYRFSVIALKCIARESVGAETISLNQITRRGNEARPILTPDCYTVFYITVSQKWPTYETSIANLSPKWLWWILTYNINNISTTKTTGNLPPQFNLLTLFVAHSGRFISGRVVANWSRIHSLCWV